MALPTVTPGQGVFTFGIDPTSRLMVDSTKPASTTAEIVAGYPIALDQSAASLTDNCTWTTSDIFYGVSSSNVNTLAGRTSLGEFEANKVNAELIGRYKIRKSVFLNSAGAEVTASPFLTNAGAASWPTTADIGKTLAAIAVTIADTNDAFYGSGATTKLVWCVATSGTNNGFGPVTANGFSHIGTITDVSSDTAATEVEIMLTGARVAYIAGGV